jgi:hypothetical protein
VAFYNNWRAKVVLWRYVRDSCKMGHLVDRVPDYKGHRRASVSHVSADMQEKVHF